jgi:hypothetical protein
MTPGLSRLWVALFMGYLAVAGGHLYTADDWSRFHAARSFLLHFSPELPDLPHVYGVQGSEGRIVSHFPPGLSMAVLPLLAAGHAVGWWVPDRQEMLERAACSLLNQVVVAWLMTLLYRLLSCTGAAPRTRLRLTLVAAFGTLAFPYAKHFWAEPLQAALLVAALLQLRAISTGGRGARRYGLFSSALAAALLVKYETVIPAAVLLAGVAVMARPRGLARWAALTAPWFGVALVLGAYNAWRFGSPLELGYGVVSPQPAPVAEASLSPMTMLRRLALLLLSPGQGLFVFVPLTALAFVRALRPSPHRVLRFGYVAGLATMLLYVVLDRSSTWCWGPRYLFLPMILWWPALAGVPRSFRGSFAVLAGAGVVIAVLGVLVNFHDAIEEIRVSRGYTGWEWVDHVQREPDLSPLIWHARLVWPYLKRTVEDASRVSEPAEAPVMWRHRHVDVLWLALWVGGASPPILAVPVLLIGLALWQLRLLSRDFA